MPKRSWIHLALVASLAGCAQTMTVSDSARLEEGEGAILFSMKCGPGIAWGQVYRSGESSKGYAADSGRAGLLQCSEGVQTQRLKAGRYFVGKVGYQGLVDFSEERAMQFDVAAGKVNYIGHIALPSSVDRRERSRTVLIGDPFVNDRREDALAWLTAHQASSQKYEFLAALAQSPSKRTQGELIQSGLAERGGPSGATEFTVVLKLRVGADGSVREGHIARPSGILSLDDSALSEAVGNWRVAPAIVSGKPVEQWASYSVTYRRAS